MIMNNIVKAKYKKIRDGYVSITVLLLILLGTSCQQDLQFYDIDQTDGIYFNLVDETSSTDIQFIDSMYVSFGLEGATVMHVDVPLLMLGMPRENSREIAFEIVDSLTTGIEGVNYQVGQAIMEADTVNSTIPVSFFIPPGEEENDTIYTLTLRLVESENFRPMMNTELKIRYSSLIAQPAFWYDYILGPFTPAVLGKFFEIFRNMENTAPTLYADIIRDYGYYLDEDNINNNGVYPGEPITQFYRSVFVKYVMEELYQYFQDNPSPGVAVPDPDSWANS